MNKKKSQQADISKNILAIGFGATFGALLGYSILNSNSLDNGQDNANDNIPNINQPKRAPNNPIQPIRQEDIQKVKNYMLNKPERYKNQNIRDYTMFYFNINIGLRVLDLVNLKIGDIYKDGNIINTLHIKERSLKSASKPVRIIPLREELKLLLKDYLYTIQDWNENHYLFQARGTPNNPMNIKTINYKMREMKKALGLKGNIGTLSMTKTFSKQKCSQLLDNGDFSEIEKVKHIDIGYRDTPEIYKSGDVI